MTKLGKDMNHYCKYYAELDIVNSGDKLNLALCGSRGPSSSSSSNSIASIDNSSQEEIA